MAAAMVSSNQGKGQPDGNDDHHHRILKVNDPVILRTCTVDESFRRMEELVGSEEEEKNWKGIVIALVVIGAILGLIATAIVIVTPANEKYEPGDPYTFAALMDDTIQVRHPSFSWTRGSDNYTVYVQQEVNSTDMYIERYVSLVDPSHSANRSDIILVPIQILSSRMRNVEYIEASPNTNYALVRLDSQTDSVYTNSTYLIYDRINLSVLDLDVEKLQYCAWIGQSSELVYVKGNDIYYKSSPQSPATQVTRDGSATLNNGVSDVVYKMYIFAKRESLIWPSPTNNWFVYAKIDQQEQEEYETDADSQPSLVKPDSYKASRVSLFLYDQKSSKTIRLPSTNGYLTSVLWMDQSQIMVVWLSLDSQVEQYLICSTASGDCEVNFEYASSDDNLHFVGMYGTPVYNAERMEYYTLLPDPQHQKKLYRHIAAIKVNKTARHDPSYTFLTAHMWSDTEILTLDGSQLYFLSTGANFTHQHLYSVDVETRVSNCLTCGNFDDTLGNVTFVKAEFSPSRKFVYLSILGPDMPSFHVIDMSTFTSGSGDLVHTQIDALHHRVVKEAYTGINLPIIEFVTVPLDDGTEASVKLILPSIFNRNKICLYELVLIINTVPGDRIATQEFSLGYQEYLAKNQTYIIALADVRGSGGRGERVRQSIHGSLGSGEAYDIIKILSFLEDRVDHYKVDKDYVAVMSRNYGGFISLHAVANEAVKCGVLSSPISSISKHGGWLVGRYMNGFSGELELVYKCTDTSAACYVPASSSILVIHGTDDAVVPVESSLTLMRQLQMAGYDFRQQIYPNIGNDIVSSDVTSHYYQTISNYLYECFEIRHKIDDSKIDYCENLQ